MSKESDESILISKKGKVRTWSELANLLPTDADPISIKFTRAYFIGQIRIAEGNIKKAKQYYGEISRKIKGYKEFEDENPQLLTAIDILVKGKTNREPEEPRLVINCTTPSK